MVFRPLQRAENRERPFGHPAAVRFEQLGF